MKRPSFQFYPGDWQSDLKLRRCSSAARGVWMDVLCAFHDSDDGYGLLRWPLKDIAATIGASMAHVRELVDKGVLRGSDTEITEAFIYTPRSGRKDGEPVTLVDTQPGPLWYSKRLVKDEYVRTIRGESTRFGDTEGESPKQPRKSAPKPPFGDGTSSSSSPSGKASPSEKQARKRAAPLDPCRDGVDPKAWVDWLDVRKAKRAGAVTDTAWAGLLREAAKAGITPDAAVRACCEFGWQGFNAEWYAQRMASRTGAGGAVTPMPTYAERQTAAKAARYAEMTGGLLGTPTIPAARGETIDMEATDGAPRLLA